MSDNIIADVFSNYGTNVLGISNEATFMLISILICVGISIMVIHFTKKKELGAVAFFMMYSIFVFLGVINWVYFIIPLILIAILWAYTHSVGAKYG